MLGFGALGKFPLGGGPFGPATVTTIGWFEALSDPVRFKLGTHSARQQFLAFDPQPFVPFAWFEALSEPVKPRRRSSAALAPFHFWEPAPSPFVATGWFEPLSEPVRQRPRSPAALYPSLFFQPAPSPFAPTGWFEALSEPVRQKQGLHASRQQFLASPSRLLPTPTAFGVLSVLETKDRFFGGALIWNRATSAELGVIDTTYFATEIGILGEDAVDASAAITSVKVSIRIL